MSRTKKSSRKITVRKKRFDEAKESFQTMQEEIAPFIKRRGFKQYSTAGGRCETSSLYS